MKKYMVTITYRSGREFSVSMTDTPEFAISQLKEAINLGANTMVITDSVVVFLSQVEQMHFREVTPGMAEYHNVR